MIVTDKKAGTSRTVTKPWRESVSHIPTSYYSGRYDATQRGQKALTPHFSRWDCHLNLLRL